MVWRTSPLYTTPVIAEFRLWRGVQSLDKIYQEGFPMPDEELKPWERGDRVLRAYEKINAAPDMVYVSDKNNNNVSRIIADLLHYCAHQNSRVISDAARQIDIGTLMAKAQAIYSFEHDTGK
jgi:hypothetical protein